MFSAHLNLKYQNTIKECERTSPNGTTLNIISAPNLSNRHLVCNDSNLLISSNGTVEVVQRLQFGVLVPEYVTLDPPWQGFGELVLGVDPRGHSEDVIEFFKCSLFGLWYKQEDEDQGSKVEPGVESKSTNRVEHLEDTRERDGENGRPEEASGDGPGHADFTMREWENLGGVSERHGAFTWGVEGGEKENEEGNHAKMGSAVLRDDEAKSGCKQSPCHVGEGKEKESAATPGIDSPDRGPSKDEVDETESERG